MSTAAPAAPLADIVIVQGFDPDRCDVVFGSTRLNIDAVSATQLSPALGIQIQPNAAAA